MNTVFTKGPHRFYERLMQQMPRYERSPVPTMEERGCKLCRYYDLRRRKCSQEKCIVFDD